MESYDQSSLDALTGNASPYSLIPESFITLFVVGIIIVNVLGLIWVIFYVIMQIRAWKVQTATLQIQKDIAEIKQQLAKSTKLSPAPPLLASTSSEEDVNSSEKSA